MIPSCILDDMDLDGVDVQVMHPNLSLFGLYSDDHELSMAHARVYNDYVIERFAPYFARLAPTAPVPLTDIDDAVAEIERVAAARVPCDPPARRSRRSRTTRATSTRCGRRPRRTACTCSSTRRPAA